MLSGLASATHAHRGRAEPEQPMGPGLMQAVQGGAGPPGLHTRRHTELGPPCNVCSLGLGFFLDFFFLYSTAPCMVYPTARCARLRQASVDGFNADLLRDEPAEKVRAVLREARLVHSL